MAVCRQIAKTGLRIIRGLVVRISKRIDLRTDVEGRKNIVIDTDSQGATKIPALGNRFAHRGLFIILHFIFAVSKTYANACIPHQVRNTLDVEITINTCRHIIGERLSIGYGTVVRDTPITGSPYFRLLYREQPDNRGYS